MQDIELLHNDQIIIDLSNYKPFTEIIEILEYLLEENIQPQALDISFNNIGINRMKLLAPLLEQFTCLEDLDLSGNYLSIDTLTILAPALSKLTQLKILKLKDGNGRKCNDRLKIIVNVLPKLTQLKTLSLRFAFSWGDMTILKPALEQLTQLEDLDLSQPQPEPSNIRDLIPSLAKLTRLQTLNLAGHHLGPDGMKILADILPQLTQLKSLNLSYNFILDEGMKILEDSLEQLPKLQALNLQMNKPRPNGMVRIVPKLTQLKGLVLSWRDLCSEGKTTIVSTLPKLTQLHALEFSNTLLSPKCNGGIIPLAPSLATLIQLKALNLTRNFLGPEGMMVLANILPQLTQLQDLNLCTNELGPKEMNLLADILPQLTQLKSLNLSLNEIGDEGMKILAPALVKLPLLQNLNLYSNQLGLEAMTILADILVQLPRLQILNIDDNHLKPDSMKILVPVLATLTQLKKCKGIQLQKFIIKLLLCNAQLKLTTKVTQQHIQKVRDTQETFYQSNTIQNSLEKLYGIIMNFANEFNFQLVAHLDAYYALILELALMRGCVGMAFQTAQQLSRYPINILSSYVNPNSPLLLATMIRELANDLNSDENAQWLMHCLTLINDESLIQPKQRYRLLLTVAKWIDPCSRNDSIQRMQSLSEQYPKEFEAQIKNHTLTIIAFDQLIAVAKQAHRDEPEYESLCTQLKGAQYSIELEKQLLDNKLVQENLPQNKKVITYERLIQLSYDQHHSANDVTDDCGGKKWLKQQLDALADRLEKRALVQVLEKISFKPPTDKTLKFFKGECDTGTFIKLQLELEDQNSSLSDCAEHLTCALKEVTNLKDGSATARLIQELDDLFGLSAIESSDSLLQQKEQLCDFLNERYGLHTLLRHSL